MIRYTTYVYLKSFDRATFDNTNTFLGDTLLGLNITSGPNAGQKLQRCVRPLDPPSCITSDQYIQFYNPYVLNAIHPARMLIGTRYIYESFDMGEHLANLLNTPLGADVTSLTYGSRTSTGVAKPEVFYVAAGNFLVHRPPSPGAVTAIAGPGASLRAVVMDPQNYLNVYVVDANSHVWGSANEGATWTDLTSNLPTLCKDVRTVEIYNPGGITNTKLLVGCMGGVFVLSNPGAPGSWQAMGSNLPHGLVLTVKYDYTSNVLLAGYLGRGAWKVCAPFTGNGSCVGAVGTPAPVAVPPISTLPSLPPVATPKGQ